MSQDDAVVREVSRFEIAESLFIGRVQVQYECPACNESLKSKLDDAGRVDKCPVCETKFIVPGAAEKAKREEGKQEKSRRREEADSNERHRLQAEFAARAVEDSRRARAARRNATDEKYPIAQFVAAVSYVLAVATLLGGLIAIVKRLEQAGEWDWFATTTLVVALGSAAAYAFMAELVTMIREMAINSWHTRRHLEKIEKSGRSDPEK